MNTAQKPNWFHAKRHGWGWGLPASWQGRVVLIVWIAIITSGGGCLALKSMWLSYLFVAVMVIALLTICLLKGEPPRWRWGKG